MPLILPGNVGSATAATGFNVDNSCLFHRADSADMTLSMSSGGSQTKFTKSFWIKRCKIGEQHYIYDNSGTTQIFFHFRDTDKIGLGIFNSGAYSTELVSTQLFRDVSAWYHFVIAVDYTNATQALRARIYVNGTEITAFDTETRPGNDSTTFDTFNSSKTHYIGSNASTNHYLHGYLAEVVHIDNAQLAPDQFGEFDEDSGIWKPIDVSGLTFGTKGYYLDFEDSANLGNDANGGTDWTENNLAATDQSTDTCTNNFATFNGVLGYNSTIALAEGNIKGTTPSTHEALYGSIYSSIGVTKGKWYAEFKVTTNSNHSVVGISADMESDADGSSGGAYNFTYLGQGLGYFGSNGKVFHSDSNTQMTYGSAVSNNDIVGVAMDVDNQEVYFSINGTFQNSGDPTSGSSKTGGVVNEGARNIFSTGTGTLFFAVADFDRDATCAIEANFGGGSVSAISSGNSDGNGYGNFEYAVPSGYYSLCTKNLAEFGG